MEKQGPVKEAARISENQKPVDEVWRSVGLRDAERPRASVLRYLALWERMRRRG